MTCLCTGRPPCWVCDDGPTPYDLALADAIDRRANEVYPEDIFRTPDSDKCAEMHAVIREHRDGMAAWRDDGQDHHQTHGNGAVSAEEREMDHGEMGGSST